MIDPNQAPTSFEQEQQRLTSQPSVQKSLQENADLYKPGPVPESNNLAPVPTDDPKIDVPIYVSRWSSMLASAKEFAYSGATYNAYNAIANAFYKYGDTGPKLNPEQVESLNEENKQYGIKLPDNVGENEAEHIIDSTKSKKLNEAFLAHRQMDGLTSFMDTIGGGLIGNTILDPLAMAAGYLGAEIPLLGVGRAAVAEWEGVRAGDEAYKVLETMQRGATSAGAFSVAQNAAQVANDVSQGKGYHIWDHLSNIANQTMIGAVAGSLSGFLSKGTEYEDQVKTNLDNAQIMSNEHANKIQSTSAYMAYKGKQIDVSTLSKYALLKSGEKLRAKMEANGFSVEDANAALDDIDNNIKTQLDPLKSEYDRYWDTFKKTNTSPEYLKVLDEHSKDLEREKADLQTRIIESNLEKSGLSIANLERLADKTSDQTLPQKEISNTNDLLKPIVNKISKDMNKEGVVFNDSLPVGDVARDIVDRYKTIKENKSIHGRDIQDKFSKVRESLGHDENKPMSDILDEYNNTASEFHRVDSHRLDSSLLREMINQDDSSQINSGDLDNFYNALFGKEPPIDPEEEVTASGQEVENAENALDDQFSPEERSLLEKNSDLDDEEKFELEKLKKDASGKALKKVLPEAIKCFIEESV